jgi:serine/threonine-protein kinase
LGSQRFTPGQVLADRYRIVSRLGQGGMGEVYRADDLRLGQAVALKFLPEKWASDPQRRADLHEEVRLAREISHPHVCRVHDIAEADGQPLLSMEFIDGENLAALLRQIGRLPPDKGVEIARQLCLGLAAAHEKGVLHRDLKPANVMLDGRGRVRITDFGLARLAERVTGADARSGTPHYMAPEQAAGKEATVRSDVYALGLVLYEMFTGKKAFTGATPEELARLKEQSSPPTPSSHVSDLDPAVERIILRCLEREPDKRPESALAVA